MAGDDNNDVVRRFTREVLDGGNIDAAERYVAPDFFNHVTGQAGIEPFKERLCAVRALLTAPTVEDHLIADGDKVAQFLTVSGVHSQPAVFHGTVYPPTGRAFSARHAHPFRLRDGLLVEHWAIRDDLSLPRALGIVHFRPPE